MIKCNNTDVEIKADEGIPGVMTDLTIILRSVKFMLREEGMKEKNADDFIDHCVRLSRASEEELVKEAEDRRKRMLGTLLSFVFGGGTASPGSVEEDE